MSMMILLFMAVISTDGPGDQAGKVNNVNRIYVKVEEEQKWIMIL